MAGRGQKPDDNREVGHDPEVTFARKERRQQRPEASARPKQENHACGADEIFPRQHDAPTAALRPRGTATDRKALGRESGVTHAKVQFRADGGIEGQTPPLLSIRFSHNDTPIAGIMCQNARME